MKKLPLLFFLLSVTLEVVAQQDSSVELRRKDFIRLVNTLDSVDHNKNYHILVDNRATHGLDGIIIHVWNSDRLGDTFLKPYGINICDFFNHSSSHVFVYRYEACTFELPPGFLSETKENDSYSYLELSPFYDKDCSYQVFQPRNVDGRIVFDKLKFNLDSSLIREVQDLFKND